MKKSKMKAKGGDLISELICTKPLENACSQVAILSEAFLKIMLMAS